MPSFFHESKNRVYYNNCKRQIVKLLLINQQISVINDSQSAKSQFNINFTLKLLQSESTLILKIMTERIMGNIVILRSATLNDRQPIFDWLTNSDLTKFMMGPPTYPDSPIPTWQEFLNDYMEYFFDGSRPLLGRCFIIEVNSEPVGQINHDKISMTNHSTELDIWLKSSKFINKGYGTDAIVTLCNLPIQ